MIQSAGFSPAAYRKRSATADNSLAQKFAAALFSLRLVLYTMVLVSLSSVFLLPGFPRNIRDSMGRRRSRSVENIERGRQVQAGAVL